MILGEYILTIVTDHLNYPDMNVAHLTSQPALILTALFLAGLIAGWLLKFWLNLRNLRHVHRHRNSVPQAFVGAISQSAHRKAADYTIEKTRVGLIEISTGAAVVVGWTLLGGLSALNQVLQDWLGAGLIQQVALVICFVTVNGVIDLPLSLYQTFVIEQKFGFNRMTLQLWLLDLAKSTVVGLAVGLPIIALVLWLMGSVGPSWWIWAWAAWVALSLMLMVVFPSFIAPLFNKFTPLADDMLQQRIDRLMHRCGFKSKGLFVMDGSRRSAHANAYFTGLGHAKRVVFFDTLLSKLTPAEVEAVLAHELGHFSKGHIPKRIAVHFAFSFLGFFILGWLAGQVWFYWGLGVQPNLDSHNDALAIVLFMLALPVFTTFISPLFARQSRQQEFEADAFAVQHSDGNALASALLKLSADNASTLTPDRAYAQFYYSHPPVTERISKLAN